MLKLRNTVSISEANECCEYEFEVHDDTGKFNGLKGSFRLEHAMIKFDMEDGLQDLSDKGVLVDYNFYEYKNPEDNLYVISMKKDNRSSITAAYVLSRGKDYSIVLRVSYDENGLSDDEVINYLMPDIVETSLTLSENYEEAEK